MRAVLLSVLAIFVVAANARTITSSKQVTVSSSDELASLIASLLASSTDSSKVIIKVTSSDGTTTTTTSTSSDDTTEETTETTTEDSDDSDEDDSEESDESDETEESDESEDTTSSTTDTFVEDLLTVHNEYRTLCGVANLTLNSTLNAYAQEWAEYLAENSLFQHRDDTDYGENLYMSSAVSTAQDAGDAWYSEISDYTDYTSEPDMTSFSSGHYTQMVWKGSEQMGCGYATASSGAFYVACNYNPAGNYIGQFVDNVLAPSS